MLVACELPLQHLNLCLQVQEALLDGAHSINRLREDVQGLTTWVESGALAERLGEQPKKKASMLSGGKAAEDMAPAAAKQERLSGDGSGGERRRSSGWSAVLPPSHLKIGGMVGLLARVPLGSRSSAGESRPHTALEEEEEASATMKRPKAEVASDGEAKQDRLALDRVPLLRAGTEMVRSSVDWLSHSGLAQQGTALRPVASGGVQLQLGSLHRSFLDFTRVMAKLDLGLVSHQGRPGSMAAAESGPFVKRRVSRCHPALALEGQGAWHALTVSCCQQLAGPVRLCADLRFVIERCGAEAAAEQQQSGPQAAVTRSLRSLASSLRPSLLDAAYGIDVALPQASGLARVAAWYSPRRQEAMVELRLF